MSHLSAPENLVYSLPSIIDRIRLEELFSAAQPLEVELGSGDGSFLLQWAAAHPERNFIGVERLLGRVQKLDRKGRRMNLKNLRGIRIESSYFLEHLLPPNSTDAVHIYFPDPWPKLKHRRHRLINDCFPDLARRVLVENGVVYLRTDDLDYFEQMKAVFNASSSFKPIETPPHLKAVVTDFEAFFNAQGIKTNYAAFQRL